MPSPFIYFFAGMGAVALSLGAGFTGGVAVGSNWWTQDHAPVAKIEPAGFTKASIREIPMVQQAAVAEPGMQMNASGRTDADNAAARKLAAEKRKMAKAQKREAQRRKQKALEAVGKPMPPELANGPILGFAPTVVASPQ
jgi:hypothetical protein